MLLATSRLSVSPIWQLQKLAYNRLGVENWAKGRVPFLMTNNSRFAAQVADIACAAFQSQPFTLLELGGGCGKFAFLCINELLQRKAKVRYFLTDAAEKNVAFWESHPRLKPWIDQGILQTAALDPLSHNPPRADFIVANYFFDSIPQDLFRVEKGVLLEGQASLFSSPFADVEKADWEDPSLLAKIRIEISFRPLEENPYPEFPEAREVLEEYSRSGDLSFLFPIGALTVIRRIESSSRGDFLILAADRGSCRAKGLPKSHRLWGKKDLSSMSLMPSLHGSAFSFPVNFHSIGRYIEKKKGHALFSQSQTADFCLALLSNFPQSRCDFGGPLSQIPKAWLDAQPFGPLKTEAADFKDILKRLEEANWDAALFFSFFDLIVESFAQAKEREKKEMVAGMRRILDRFFSLFGEESLLLERLGQFFTTIGELSEAAAHFQMAALLKAMPRQSDSAGYYLEVNPPRGDVLQVGGPKRSFKGVRNYKYIAWSESRKRLREFDTILMFPPRVIVEKQQPAFVREIEERFSLKQIRYTDNDIEAFLSSLSGQTDPTHVLHFLGELKRKKNISREQFDRFAKRLGFDALAQKEDNFFEILMICLKKHMNPGAVLRAFLPGLLTYDDPRFFEKIAVDPYLETEEISEAAGVWLSIKKL